MSELIPHQSDPLSVAKPSRRTVKARRDLEGRSEIELVKLDRQARIGTQRARTVARVGTRAMEAQAIVSMTERMIVEMEAGAVHGISYLSQRLTIGLGQVIDKTIDEVC